MTNKEAIAILSHELCFTNDTIRLIKDGNKFYGSLEENEEWASCLDLAIKALEENQKIKDLFSNANDADDFYHEVRVLFEGE